MGGRSLETGAPELLARLLLISQLGPVGVSDGSLLTFEIGMDQQRPIAASNPAELAIIHAG